MFTLLVLVNHWNALPMSIQSINERDGFKTTVKLLKNKSMCIFYYH